MARKWGCYAGKWPASGAAAPVEVTQRWESLRRVSCVVAAAAAAAPEENDAGVGGVMLLPPLRRRGEENGADEEEEEEKRAGKMEDARVDCFWSTIIVFERSDEN